MTINVNASIYELQDAFWKSNGCVAVVDNDGMLLGLFGQKENTDVTINMIDKYDEGIDIIDVINRKFSAITISKDVEKDVEKFFDETMHTYVPIISVQGEFIRFEINPRQDVRQVERKQHLHRIVEKWSAIDKDKSRFKDYKYKCNICDNEIDTNTAKELNCVCLFGGGILTRYTCPSCGAISGPLKMLTLSKEELDKDYMEHYSLFEEGDTTEDEINTFFRINPQKGKKYLNYGCGGTWSKSIENLREQGYTVLGYEPYAASSDVEYIITQPEELKGYKFDGIFSNNVLEHLYNPIEELKFMGSLLRDENSVMAHSTGCYEYRYPYTRFHVCFPVGKSAEVMFKNAGFQQIERSEKVLHGDKQICIIVKPIK